MPWDPARTRRDSQPSDFEIEAAAKAKHKHEQQEKDKLAAAEAKKASAAVPEVPAHISGGLFRMVGDDFETPQPASPTPPRKTSADSPKGESESPKGDSEPVTPAAYPVNQLPIQRSGIVSQNAQSRERGISADQVIERGMRASKEFFAAKPSKDDLAEEVAPDVSDAVVAEEPPAQQSAPPAEKLIIQQLFEQLRAERERADRLEEKVHALTEQLVDAHEKHAGVLERENERWAQVNRASGLLKTA